MKFKFDSKFKIQNSKFSRGFTLIELILVVAILSIIAGTFFINANGGQAALAVQRSAQLTVQGLREAQNSALGAKVAGSPPAVPTGGWGVSFRIGSDPILFADVNGDHQYEAGTDVLVRTITLDSKAPVTAVSSVGGSGSMDIVFLAPNPSIYINGVLNTPSSTDVTVTVVANSGGTVTKTIHVNAIGSISVQ